MQLSKLLSCCLINENGKSGPRLCSYRELHMGSNRVLYAYVRHRSRSNYHRSTLAMGLNLGLRRRFETAASISRTVNMACNYRRPRSNGDGAVTLCNSCSYGHSVSYSVLFQSRESININLLPPFLCIGSSSNAGGSARLAPIDVCNAGCQLAAACLRVDVADL